MILRRLIFLWKCHRHGRLHLLQYPLSPGGSGLTFRVILFPIFMPVFLRYTGSVMRQVS